MLEGHVLKFDVTSLKVIINRPFLFRYQRLLLQHVEQVFNINLRLIDFSEQCAHVEKRASQLHEQCLDHHEISRCQMPS